MIQRRRSRPERLSTLAWHSRCIVRPSIRTKSSSTSTLVPQAGQLPIHVGGGGDSRLRGLRQAMPCGTRGVARRCIDSSEGCQLADSGRAPSDGRLTRRGGPTRPVPRLRPRRLARPDPTVFGPPPPAARRVADHGRGTRRSYMFPPMVGAGEMTRMREPEQGGAWDAPFCVAWTRRPHRRFVRWQPILPPALDRDCCWPTLPRCRFHTLQSGRARTRPARPPSPGRANPSAGRRPTAGQGRRREAGHAGPARTGLPRAGRE